jgi:predicted dehydrogenase/threonine dehydrogenase-like Zn-dependent dehydrogenase
MKQVIIKSGKIVVEEFPIPFLENNSVLVEVAYSLISTGTETASLNAAGESLVKKTLKRPENIKKAAEMIKNQGISKLLYKIKNQAETFYPIGYSCAGRVVAVGANVLNFKAGDPVACAGGGYASHAEFVCVPKNLVVKLPHRLGLKEASSVTIGAIALQGVRRASPQIGEFVAVIGLGLIGQITVQILKAAGCRVIGLDIEKKRIEQAKTMGLDYGVSIEEEEPVLAVIKFTNGIGADSTIITASSKSNLPVNQAMEMTRKKGKVVCVGDVGLTLERDAFYKKELDFLISTSYGPGRYDVAYEEDGIDYPYAYVRWTENRNMREYIELLSDGKINIPAFINKEYPAEEAAIAFEELKSAERPLGIFLRFHGADVELEKERATRLETKILLHSQTPDARPERKIFNVGVIGAGSFANDVHLPNLRKLAGKYRLYAVIDANPIRAKEAAKRFGATYAATDYKDFLDDKNIDLLMVCTRHDLHAGLVIEAIKAGKKIFVEKPLCLVQNELEEIKKVYHSASQDSPWLMVGFNRRFSPMIVEVKDILSSRTNPLIVNYRMNAGYIPPSHWVHSKEGGGRNISEACHIYDLFNYLTDSRPISSTAFFVEPKTDHYRSNDNFVATFKYRDGSLCNLIYTALGNDAFPKEQMEIYSDGKILALNNYKRLDIFGEKKKHVEFKRPQKGHFEELAEMAKSVQSAKGAPIPFEQLIMATQMSFDVEKQIRS